MERGLEGKYVWEAQYWWAFSCLLLAGRRTAADFHAELLRRSSDLYPAPQEVQSIVDEAITHLADVLNASLSQHLNSRIPASGWERHLLALSSRPESAIHLTSED